MKTRQKIRPRALPVGVPEPPKGWIYVGCGDDVTILDDSPYSMYDPEDEKYPWEDGYSGDSDDYHYALPIDHPALWKEAEHVPSLNVVESPSIAPTAICDSLPGARTKVWNFSHIREDAHVGADCIIGDYVYIDKGVSIASRCKIGNNAQIFGDAVIGCDVFIGPGALIINDKHPRASMDGRLLAESEWKKESVYVGMCSSIGAGAILMPGVAIGINCVVGAGAIVTKDMPSNTKWIGVKSIEDVEPQEDPTITPQELDQMIKDAVDEGEYNEVISLARQRQSM